MARSRSIKPSFFKSEILAECDPSARLLFAGLWTLADCEGRMEYRPKLIKAEIFPYEECDVVSLLSQLEERGFVRRYSVGGKNYLDIPTFGKHQHTHKGEKPQGFPSFEQAEHHTSTEQRRCKDGAKTVQEPDKDGANPPVICNLESVICNLDIPSAADAASPLVQSSKSDSPKQRDRRPTLIRSEDCDFPNELNTPAVRASLDEWLEHKAALRNPYKSPASVNKLLRQWSRAGPERFIAVVDRAIAHNWKGLHEGESHGGHQHHRPGQIPSKPDSTDFDFPTVTGTE